MTKKIAVSTGGGDAPGLNAVIRAVTVSAVGRGWEVYGIREGYDGLLDMYPEQGLIHLDRAAVRGITFLGGTILGTTNRGNPFRRPTADGGEEDRSDELVRKLHELGFDALVSIGGDGSLAIAHELCKKGIPVVGVPKTIDNDVRGTVITFGFDTAVSIATEAIDRLHTTAEAHRRVMVVELMGRHAGWIALNAGVAGTADAILIPEIPYDIDKVAQKIIERDRRGRRFSIVVVAEGAQPVGGEPSVAEAQPEGAPERLKGAGERVAKQLEERTGKDTRALVLGHLQRGGPPSAFDRLLALRFGTAAVRAIAEDEQDVMVALDPPEIKTVPLSEVVGGIRPVPVDNDTVRTARELGISFGD